MKNFITSLVLLLISTTAFCQKNINEAFGEATGNKLRENGMIYIVVGVLLIVLIGIITYLILIDRKVSKIEDQLNSQSK